MATRKTSRVGGPRKGSGRPPGTGPGPSPYARRNRVTILLSDSELKKLKRLADQRGWPFGTVAYEFVARGLKRLK